MATKSSRSQPFAIYTDYTSLEPYHRTSMSPSPYDADHGMSSDDNDSILPSIESPPNARKSSAAFTSVSSIPPSLPYDSDISPYTPRKTPRPAFRSPSSVRALQMASPPPFASPRSGRMESPLSARRHRPGTPSSMRSGSVLHNEVPRRHIQQFDEMSSPSHGNGSGRGTPSTQHTQSPSRPQGPLVLLHVTVLPCPGLPYSAESLQELAPSYVLKNWHLLQEKLSETLLARGVLIPHPGEEFDLLEEHLLETLGLCVPRIGNCGHFHGPDLDSDTDSGNDSGVSGLGRRSNEVLALRDRPHAFFPEVDSEDDVCHDCDQPMRIPGKGIGSGTNRWEIKIYAANGLMRAGAWSACWREMERVDIEVEPWIPDDVRRALDRRLEQEEDELRKQNEEIERLRFDVEVVEKMRSEADEARLKAEKRVTDLAAELELAKTIQPPPALAPATVPEQVVTPKKRGSIPSSDPIRAPCLTPIISSHDIPLSTLLRNYVLLLAQDRRNIALGLLSVLVILLSIQLASPQAAAIAPLDVGTTMHPASGHYENNTTTSSHMASQLLPLDEERPVTDTVTNSAVSASSVLIADIYPSPTLELGKPIPSIAAEESSPFSQAVESPLLHSEGTPRHTSHCAHSLEAEELQTRSSAHQLTNDFVQLQSPIPNPNRHSDAQPHAADPQLR